MQESEIKTLIDLMREKKLRIVTAESLTCGMISSALTNISGASDVVNGGFSVYQDEMKTALLGVPADMLQEFTAVSAPVAKAMAKGALEKTGSDVLKDKTSNISIAVTGYASDPGNADLTGLVFIGIGTQFNTAGNPEIKVYGHNFNGNRDVIRQTTTDQALQYVMDLMKEI